MSELREECGVFGVYAPEETDVASVVYYGLYALQHRGQESCGIVVNDDGVFAAYKDSGLVNDVFTKARLRSLGGGQMALGHVRYGRNGAGGERWNAQPIVVNHVKGRMALAYNGALVNGPSLRRELELLGSIFHTNSDAEIMSYLITRERLTAPSIEESVNRMMRRLVGAYAMVVMSPQKLIAFKDPHGFKPLCYGYRESDGAYLVASESCALDSVGAKLVREIEPGEIVVFDKDGVRSIRDHCGGKESFCVFEYLYFARPDSMIGGNSVNQVRLRAGAFLALEHPVDADVVIGIPDSGIDAAVGFARQSGIPYEIGFIKNKYIGRTFIAPGEEERNSLVRIKLNPISSVVRGKRVVLVDDSIVRGTTCRRVVNLLRQAGALEVHMRSSAPPFVDLCYYGTDIRDRESLAAYNRTTEEVAKLLLVDSLGYLGVENVAKLTPKRCGGLCTACFSREYPTEVPETPHVNKYDKKISEGERSGGKPVEHGASNRLELEKTEENKGE